MIRGIHHIALNSANFDRMVQFYTDLLGFVPTTEPRGWASSPRADSAVGLKDSAADVILLKAGNCYIEIFQYSQPQPREAEPLRACDRGYTHLALDTDDVQADFARLSAAGMEFVHPEPVDHGHVVSVYGRDPDGNLIELQQISESNPSTLDAAIETFSG